jgi:hypothetical protein
VLKIASNDIRLALLRLRYSIRDGLVQDVPVEYAICEFDCRKPECTLAEWTTCKRRLEMAAGELMPKSSSLESPAPQPQATLVHV